MPSLEERLARNRLHQARFRAKKRGELVPDRYSSHDDEATTTSAREARAAGELAMMPEERQEHEQYLAAVRQHLADVAAGDIPPASLGPYAQHRRRWGGA